MPCCSRILALLADYIEGRLPSDTHAELEHHLTGCSRCVDYVNTYRSTVSLLRSLREDDLPVELRSRLTAFIDDHQSRN